MPTRRRLLLALTILLVAAVLGGTSLLLLREGKTLLTGSGTALVGGPFTLTDQTGKKVSDSDFRGKYMLVFFGYTFCPDICPTELQVISSALDQMGPAADAIQPIFVTIDPARDTPEVVKGYVASFHPRLTGLTGTEAEIAAAAQAYRVYYKQAGGSGSDYLMDHSSIVYLMDRDGKFLKHFPYTTDAAGLAKGLQEALNR